ncbi:hypothetical protein GCK32_010334 [Trichostrongylus colubriformis]|uniref:Uncharacterized protein n=1 Tax=Trichostrongylus colubriformis TaxID=6319 RepID=A0AAN8IGK0_TRICO
MVLVCRSTAHFLKILLFTIHLLVHLGLQK